MEHICIIFLLYFVSIAMKGILENSNLTRNKIIFDSKYMLELRQYKNDSIQSEIIPRLKLPHFFSTYTVRGKERQFQNWNYFWQNGVVLILSLL